MPRRRRTMDEAKTLHAEVLQRFLLTDHTICQIGKDLCVDSMYVRKILHAHYVPIVRKPRHPGEPLVQVAKRNQTVSDQYRQGVPVATIAATFNLTERFVRTILSAQGVTSEREQVQRLARTERNRQIVDAKAAGQSREDIAARFMLSVRRVAEIIADEQRTRGKA